MKFKVKYYLSLSGFYVLISYSSVGLGIKFQDSDFCDISNVYSI